MEAITSEFLKEVEQQYKDHCKRKEIEDSTEYFLQYLINRNIITDTTIKRFVVINEYPKALDNLGIKRNAIWEIEAKFNVCESTIKVWLGRFQKHFRLKHG